MEHEKQHHHWRWRFLQILPWHLNHHEKLTTIWAILFPCFSNRSLFLAFFQPRICLVPNDPPQFLESKDGFQVAYGGRHMTVVNCRTRGIFEMYLERNLLSTWKPPLCFCSGNFNGLFFYQRIAKSQKDCLSTWKPPSIEFQKPKNRPVSIWDETCFFFEGLQFQPSKQIGHIGTFCGTLWIGSWGVLHQPISCSRKLFFLSWYTPPEVYQ